MSPVLLEADSAKSAIHQSICLALSLSSACGMTVYIQRKGSRLAALMVLHRLDIIPGAKSSNNAGVSQIIKLEIWLNACHENYYTLIRDRDFYEYYLQEL